MTAAAEPALTLDPSEFARRVIRPGEFVADRSAFVDVRLPRSAGKASYSLIGPGVSQNPDQVVNLPEAHGFHVGAASMGHGVVNNQHMHFTAEVFICTRGAWRMRIGEISPAPPICPTPAICTTASSAILPNWPPGSAN